MIFNILGSYPTQVFCGMLNNDGAIEFLTFCSQTQAYYFEFLYINPAGEISEIPLNILKKVFTQNYRDLKVATTKLSVPAL